MGNMFNKRRKYFNNDNTDLYKSLLHTNINEKITYIENKLDNLDNDFMVFKCNTEANLKVISSDIHLLYSANKKS
mgnify:CR=1 FL=1|tara:strand:+ start:888 stop:1112 length:225 start_codon:yes stop_codon:yes gene_type:complete